MFKFFCIKSSSCGGYLIFSPVGVFFVYLYGRSLYQLRICVILTIFCVCFLFMALFLISALMFSSALVMVSWSFCRFECL